MYRYEGEIEDNMMYGRGILIMPSGLKYKLYYQIKKI